MDFEQIKLNLDSIQRHFDDLEEKAYLQWCEIDRKEFPPLDEFGNYVPHPKDKKPSRECEQARQKVLAFRNFCYSLRLARRELNNIISLF